VLGDERQAEEPGLARVPERDGTTVPLDHAGVGAEDAGGDRDQRGLAGAVLAEERMDLAGRTARWAPSSARVAPNVLTIPSISSAGVRPGEERVAVIGTSSGRRLTTDD